MAARAARKLVEECAMSMFRLDGKVVIVTGASAGLGVAFAEACAEAGADLVLAARRVDRLVDLEKRVAACGCRAISVKADVSSRDDCFALVSAAVEAFGRVDVLVNNAGVGSAVPATRETEVEFRSVLDINLAGAYWMAQACGGVMKEGSSIVNVSSVLALTTADLPQAAYSASKAGLLGLTRDLARQWGGRKGIRVNAIAPGFFDTEMTTAYPDGYFDTLLPRISLGRKGDPDELAATLIWLVSPAGGYVTGQTIVVDGGFTIA
jgi:NAD(P)-dependent dehydrogenase (short-subunit alcohol dehydrogenase family)